MMKPRIYFDNSHREWRYRLVKCGALKTARSEPKDLFAELFCYILNQKLKEKQNEQ